DFAGPDSETRGSDDVVVPANKADITFLVHDPLVAGRHPVADKFVTRGFGLVPVFKEHHRVGTPDCDLPDLSRLQRTTGGVDDRDRMAGHRPADGAGLRDLYRAARRKHDVAFGLSIELIDDKTECRLAPFVGFRTKRFTARADRTHADSVAVFRIRYGAQHAKCRRWNKGVADLRPRHQRESLFRIEFLKAPRHHRHAVMKP